jgi:hypothetical protein
MLLLDVLLEKISASESSFADILSEAGLDVVNVKVIRYDVGFGAEDAVRAHYEAFIEHAYPFDVDVPMYAGFMSFPIIAVLERLATCCTSIYVVHFEIVVTVLVWQRSCNIRDFIAEP